MAISRDTISHFLWNNVDQSGVMWSKMVNNISSYLIKLNSI